MNKNEIFKSYKLDINKLIKYGFKLNNEGYTYKQEIGLNLYVVFCITSKTFNINVYDCENDLEYLPFYVKNKTGSYVKKVQEVVDKLIQDILDNCFDNCNIKEKMLLYIKEKYGTIPDYPWTDSPEYCTVRSTNNKWYGLFMTIKSEAIGLDHDGYVDVVNLKHDSKNIIEIIDKRTIFPAYHMNKKYWITVLLNRDTDIEFVKKLIDESYNLVNTV